MTAMGALCRLTAFPRSCPTARGPVPDGPLRALIPVKPDVPTSDLLGDLVEASQPFIDNFR